MGYQGYLIQVGDYKIPLSMMASESYQVLRSGQDLDSLRNENGKLNRNALEHFIMKVEFETPALKTDSEMQVFLSNIRRNFINKTEQNVKVKMYVPMLGDYVEQEMYVPDITFKIYMLTDDIIKYERTRIAFIGY